MESIRLATPEDAKGIATVHVKMWQHNYRGQIPDSFLDDMSIETRTEGWEKMLINPEPKTHAFVAEVNGFIAGWVTGGVSRDGDLPGEVGELYGIYIHPDYASKGLGTKLMSRLLKTLKQEGYAKATLWVLDSNQKTRDLYEHRGWKPEGKTKVDHREGFDLNEVRYITDL